MSHFSLPTTRGRKLSPHLALALSLFFLLALASIASASMGDIRAFSVIDDKTVDIVGAGTKMSSDGTKDLGFKLDITGGGAISGIHLQNLTTNKAWNSTPTSTYGALAVRGSDGSLLNSNGRLGVVPFLLATELEIWINDRAGLLAQNAVYQVTVRFADKSESTARVEVPKQIEEEPAAAALRITRLTYRGRENRQINGRDRIEASRISKDVVYDLVTRVRIEGEGTVSMLRLQNAAGPAAAWDTDPQEGNPLLIVLPVDSPAMYNKRDGSIQIPVNGTLDLDLVVPDSTAFTSKQAQTNLHLYFDGGKKNISAKVDRSHAASSDFATPPVAPGEGELTLKLVSSEYRGKGAYDFVGEGDKPASNMSPDDFITLRVQGGETLTGIKIVGNWESGNAKKSRTWDTTPGNGNHAVVVTRADGKPLNKLDGSISEKLANDDNLMLWFDTGNETIRNPQFKVTLLFSNGRILEFD